MKDLRLGAALRAFCAIAGMAAVLPAAQAQDALPVAANLQLAQARTLIAKATSAAQGLKAHVCIAVADAGGTLVAFDRMDGAAPGCTASAIAKAHAAAIYRAPTGVFMDMVNGGQPAVAALPEMVAIGGGVPVARDGEFYGAIGVAGSSIENEVTIAKGASDAF